MPVTGDGLTADGAFGGYSDRVFRTHGEFGFIDEPAVGDGGFIAIGIFGFRSTGKDRVHLYVFAGCDGHGSDDRVSVEGTTGTALVPVDIVAIVTGLALGLDTIAAGGTSAITIAVIAVDSVAIIAGLVIGQDPVTAPADGTIAVTAIAVDGITVVTGFILGLYSIATAPLRAHVLCGLSVSHVRIRRRSRIGGPIFGLH